MSLEGLLDKTSGADYALELGPRYREHQSTPQRPRAMVETENSKKMTDIEKRAEGP